MAEEQSHVGSVGFNAGSIYNELEDAGEKLKATELKDALELSTSDLYLAIGWLAREDQVEVLKKSNSVRVRLK